MPTAELQLAYLSPRRRRAITEIIWSLTQSHGEGFALAFVEDHLPSIARAYKKRVWRACEETIAIQPAHSASTNTSR